MNFTKLKIFAVQAGFYTSYPDRIHPGQDDITEFLIKLDKLIREDERKTVFQELHK